MISPERDAYCRMFPSDEGANMEGIREKRDPGRTRSCRITRKGWASEYGDRVENVHGKGDDPERKGINAVSMPASNGPSKVTESVEREKTKHGTVYNEKGTDRSKAPGGGRSAEERRASKRSVGGTDQGSREHRMPSDQVVEKKKEARKGTPRREERSERESGHRIAIVSRCTGHVRDQELERDGTTRPAEWRLN